MRIVDSEKEAKDIVLKASEDIRKLEAAEDIRKLAASEDVASGDTSNLKSTVPRTPVAFLRDLVLLQIDVTAGCQKFALLVLTPAPQ